jgi:hypothetical protein
MTHRQRTRGNKMNKFEITGFAAMGLSLTAFSGYWFVQMFSMLASYL